MYSPIAQDGNANGSSDKLLEQLPDEIATDRPAGRSGWRRLLLWFLACSVLVLNTVLAAYILSKHTCPSDCITPASLIYSPANVSVEYERIQFNGTIGFKSPFAGTPTPEIDDAWNRISMNESSHAIRLPPDYYERMDIPGRASNVRFHEQDGGGYMGTIDIFHVLHCLNLLRKYTYLEHYPDVQEIQRTRPKFFRDHLDHCLEMMRQNIMCASDIAVVTYDWVEDFEKPFPDFSSYHQCRNFDKLYEWTLDNSVQIPTSHVTRIGDEIDLSESVVDLSGVLTIGKGHH